MGGGGVRLTPTPVFIIPKNNPTTTCGEPGLLIVAGQRTIHYTTATTHTVVETNYKQNKDKLTTISNMNVPRLFVVVKGHHKA